MGHTIQLFHMFDTYKIVCKCYILIKLPEVQKNKDRMTEEYLFLHFSSINAYSTIKL